ncbi:D-2-hydroxyacid dehydrogenase [Aestuariibacter sp. A3R04]|uniref:D-2-hydroxyacid dehydrogenase n=1 Tax=Aestuariibacter sp. A3R04 TaxID=2841571 RepID=UPI001C095276|nr:D-2-hydroxyacid dehydrogenase [Aestuariibacter sp. A3R04]MBU3021433.1 D-2-hydroxyacid dehydrogenase [Aestuariibacter sp. A3R04]
MQHYLAVLTKEATQYQTLIPALLPANVRLQCITSKVGDVDLEKITILLADPDLAACVVPVMPALQWCQSIWAGNRPLLTLNRQDYILTAAKGMFGAPMREYLFTYLLHYSRNVDEFDTAQKAAKWAPPPYSRLQGKTLGIMGAGSIAQHILPVASAFDMRVIGLSRRGAPQTGYQHVFRTDQRLDFAQRCDFVFNLMPDTPSTTGLLNSTFFHALPRHCVLINAGRGTAIVETDLIHALNHNHIRAAVLDVFAEEPLPASHPFWRHPNIRITQHTAAESRPEDVAELFAENLRRFLTKSPLLYQFNFRQGY